MKTISLPVYRRPDRVRRLAETLRANRPVGYTLFVSAEPGYPEVIEAVKAIDFMPVELSVNAVRFGLNANIRKSLMAAMEAGSEFNVALEDDIILAPDALKLADWFSTYKHRGEYACLGFFAKNSSRTSPFEVCITQDFRSWGWCFTRSAWNDFIFPGLHCEPAMNPQVEFSHLWDFKLQYYLVRYGIKTMHPILSRSNHEGYEDGTNVLDAEIVRRLKNPILSEGCEGEFFVTRPSGKVTLDPATKSFITLRERVSA